MAADVEALDRAGLDGVLAAVRVVRAFTDALEVRVARRARTLAGEGRSEPAAEVLRERGRRSGRHAAAAAGREQTCGQLPSFEEALGTGAVSTGHVDAVTNATSRLTDTERERFARHEAGLLAAATCGSVEAFERSCRDLARAVTGDDGESELEQQRRANRVRRWVNRDTGMHHLHAELDPESASTLWAAVLAQFRTNRHRGNGPTTSHHASDPGAVATLTHDQALAGALVDVVTGARSSERRTPDVVVVVDLGTLISGLHDASVCETSDATALPPSTVRRLCCEADIIPVVLGEHGEVLDVGRAARLATPAQRRALLAMYSTCGFPDCMVSVDQCDIHHPVEWWDHHGPTNLDNLIPMCSRHHHLVHDGHWRLELTADRVVTITRPDGTTHHHGPTTNRTTTGRT